jgi:hypothetical protein
MPQRLRIKRIDTVGFVDKGDDPEAAVVFWKRAPEKETGTMHTFWKAMAEKVGISSAEADKLLADSAPEDGSGNDPAHSDGGQHMSEELTKLKADVEALTKRAEDAEAEAVEAKEKAAELEELLAKATEPDVPDPEPDVPEAVAKAMDDLEKRAKEAEEKLNKEIDRRETQQFIAKAETFGHLPGANPDDFAGILRKIDAALDEDERTKFDEILTAANKAVQTGELYKEVGSGGRRATSVEGEVAKLAEEMQKANPGMSAQVARGEVWKARPELVKAYDAERRALTSKED